MKPDGNRYEGSWEHDQKHGRGEFYFLKTGQLQEGIWENDVPCVNTICDIPYRQSCIKPTLFSIPKVIYLPKFIRGYMSRISVNALYKYLVTNEITHLLFTG